MSVSIDLYKYRFVPNIDRKELLLKQTPERWLYFIILSRNTTKKKITFKKSI
jgi:hypothetical protein